jgi:hypothetical protein
VRSGHLQHKWATLTVAGALSATATLVLFRPPSGERLLHDHLGLTSAEVSDVRAWHDLWGIDPMHAIRFRVDTAALERAAAYASLAADSQPTTGRIDRVMWQPGCHMPQWWAPPSSGDFRSRSVEYREPWLYLIFDSRTGDAHLLIIYH